MKLEQARQITSNRLQALYYKKQELTDLLNGKSTNGLPNGSFDRLELSKALSAIEEEYEQTQAVADHLSALDTSIQNAEASRQQSEAAVEAAEEIMKIMEIFRRISKGDEVPAQDEKKLMEYSYEMYLSAKNMALMSKNEDPEKHDSLWEEEGTKEEPASPSEIANNTEVGNPLSVVDASVASSDTGGSPQ